MKKYLILSLVFAFAALAFSPVAFADGTLNWTGQGTTNGELNTRQCDGNNTPYLQWNFTLGGNDNVTGATLHVNNDTFTNYTETGGVIKFITGYYDLNTATASVDYTGSLGNGNTNLTISHGCPGDTGGSNDPVYCDPSTFNGSVGRVVPKEVRCVETTVNAVCGALEGGVTNLTPFNYGISWSEDSADYNFNTSLPATFPEDYNGGSVEVFYWVVGAEADYVTGRNIPNFWEQNAASVTIDTDCDEDKQNGENPFDTPDTNPLTTSSEETTAEGQVDAPKSGVKAGFGSLTSALPAAAAFFSSLGSLAYGLFRFGKFGL